MARWLVVGAGAAGCAVAAELAARDAGDVTVVEAGPEHPPADDDHGPLVDRPERLRRERVRRRPGLPLEAYEQGRGVGGSSLVNAGLLDDDPPAGMPAEWVPVGPIGRAMLATSPDALPARLVRQLGRRVTAADALLRPLLGGTIELRTGMRIERVRLSGRRATGVVAETGELLEGDHVVLCAGAIHTPAILLRSDVDAPGVGEGVQDHPTAVLTLTPRDPPDRESAIVSAVARIGDHHVVALERLPLDPNHAALVTALLDVRSRGRIVLDHDGEPLVELHQFDDVVDLDRLAAAAATTIAWASSDAFGAVVTDAAIDDLGTPASIVAGDLDRIRAWLLARPTGHRHIAATCRDGVTTVAGRVRGYEGLAVADASVFASVPAGNPYGPVIEQARRIAARLANG